MVDKGHRYLRNLLFQTPDSPPRPPVAPLRWEVPSDRPLLSGVPSQPSRLVCSSQGSHGRSVLPSSGRVQRGTSRKASPSVSTSTSVRSLSALRYRVENGGRRAVLEDINFPRTPDAEW